MMNGTKVFVLCCFLLLNTLMVWGRIDGWIQTHANPGRSRNSDLVAYEIQSGLIKSYDMKFIPNSILMPVYALNFCGLSVDQTSNQQVVTCIGRDGQLSTNKVKIPQEYTLVDILPVMDENFGYFTVRKNSTNGVSFVLRSSVIDQTNQVFFDTKTNNQIQAMILTDYGLIIASGSFIVNVDRKSGIGNWIVNIAGVQSGCQFLYDTSTSVPTLYVLFSNGITAINPQTGGIMDTTPSNFVTRMSLSQQPFLTVGKDYIAIPNSNGNANNRVSILDRHNLKNGIIATAVINGKNGNVDLNRCTNIMSRDTNSFFVACKNNDASFSAFRFDVSNTTVSLGYEINTNSLFGIPPKVCSNQIAAFGKSGFYGLACDVGLIAFHQDNIFVPRREIHIEVNENTQVFGTMGRFALITSNNGNTLLESVYIL